MVKIVTLDVLANHLPSLLTEKLGFAIPMHCPFTGISIEFITFAIESVSFAIEFVGFALEFVVLALQFVINKTAPRNQPFIKR